MILLTGSNGFLCGHLINVLNDRKLLLLDKNKNNSYSFFPFFQLEINEVENYSEALINSDIVIHCAARVHIMNDESLNPLEEYRSVNVLGTLNLAKQAARAGVKRFIFISSIKVNGESTLFGEAFKFSDERKPKDFYGQSKAEAEELLLQVGKETGLEIVIIRPTLVYGAGVKANFASLMSLVARGIPLPFGAITNNKRSLVSVENLVDLIITCIDHPNAANQIFLVSDDHDVSTCEMINEMAKALGRKNWQLPAPVWCHKLAGKLLNKSDIVGKLVGSLQVDISHTKETLNWEPPQTLEEGFKRTAEAFLLSKKEEQNDSIY